MCGTIVLQERTERNRQGQALRTGGLVDNGRVNGVHGGSATGQPGAIGGRGGGAAGG